MTGWRTGFTSPFHPYSPHAVSAARHASNTLVLAEAVTLLPTLVQGAPSPGAALLGLRYEDASARGSGAPLRLSQRLLYGAFPLSSHAAISPRHAALPCSLATPVPALQRTLQWPWCLAFDTCGSS